MRLRGIALLACLAFTGCGGTTPAARPTTPPPVTTAPPATTAPPPTGAAPTPRRSPTPATDLADGTYYAYFKSIDLGTRTVVVDVVQFLTGEAAAKAAREDGKEADNDYYVRNTNPKLRTLTFVPFPPIVVNTLTADETGDATKDTTITVERFDGYFGLGEAQSRLYTFTLAGDAVTRIHEVYLP